MRNLLLSFLFVTIGSTVVLCQCATDRHSMIAADGWISCTTTTNPNAALGSSHWIQYDLSSVRRIEEVHLWNSNLPSQPKIAVKKLRIDVSTDGDRWSHAGDYELTMPGGVGVYEGDRIDISAPFTGRYVLMTVLETHGESCAGLAEVRFGTEAVSTSTDDVSINKVDLLISPNPVVSELTISISPDFRPHTIDVYDIAGRLMLSKPYTPSVNVASWTEGQYYIVVSDDNKHISKAFTIINPK